ncbi:peptidoglycan N-acetylglucosamine deacetylase A [Pseudoflavonifractor sp. AF19-9AC]|nr:peptidoglycan N-acetylglucosamine deacetylase A [Pseudoflavonifractor sp. AF19-9AC]
MAMERGAAGVRQYGLRGVGLGLLSLCMALALGPGTPEEIQMAGGGAQVELDTGPAKLVALTFDDGPRRSTTRRLLDGLELREANATFFLVGERIEGCEDLIEEMAEAGHQVGVHTFNHVLVTELSREDFDLQVGKTRALLTDFLGEGEFWLRPPYGIVDDSVERWADGPLVLWSVDPEDWKDRDTDRIVAAVLEHVQDGDIILMHDIYESSVDAALRIVDALTSQGYVFVTVEQLMDLRGVEPECGVCYRACPLPEEES